MSKKHFNQYVETPISLGGIGTYEFSNLISPSGYAMNTTVKVFSPSEFLAGNAKFLSLFVDDVVKRAGRVVDRKIETSHFVTHLRQDLNDFKPCYNSFQSGISKSREPPLR